MARPKGMPDARPPGSATLPGGMVPAFAALRGRKAPGIPPVCSDPLRVRIPSGKKQEPVYLHRLFFYGPPEGIRTPDLQNRNLTLYPAALRADIFF